jgi:hypothetical protein
MSACWGFSRMTVRTLGVAALLALTLAPAADARITWCPFSSHCTSASFHRHRRISIDDRGIVIHRVADDANDSDSTATISIGHDDPDPVPIRVHSSDSGNGIVRLFSDARVGPGERVDGDVVAVFGSVRVEGEVEGSAVAVFGSVALRRGAVVRGDAVAVGGGLSSEGARVSGQSVQVGFLPMFGFPGQPLVLAGIIVVWLISLFFGWIAAALFPARLKRVALMSSRRTAASLGLGILSGPLVLMATLLLMVTVIGIPIGLLLPLAYVAVVYAGQIAATYVLGCKLTRRPLGQGGIAGPLMAGSMLVASVFGFGAILWDTPGVVRTAAVFFLLVGVLLLIGLSTIGTGAFLLSRAGTRPRAPEGPLPAPAPGPPTGQVPPPAAEAPAIG